jgi:gamma-glutamyltranspeptidase/glutathione hydrolase
MNIKRTGWLDISWNRQLCQDDRIRRWQWLACAAVLSMLAGCQSPAPEQRQVALAAQGMAATAHPEATRAAREILDAGGNAADSAIAAAFVIAVVEPTMNGIGGRNQILLRNAAGEYSLYNGMTEVPASYTRPDEPPANGYGTIATPGVVAGLARLHAEHGSMPLARLLQPAIDLAANGFVLLPGEAARHADKLADMQANAGFRQALLKPDGSSYQAGEILRQPQLAATLQRLSDAGLMDFYTGTTAAAIASDMANNGGHVTAADLRDYRATDGRFVSTRYRDFEVHSIAAPAGGGLVIKTLNILENIDMSSLTDQQWGAVVNQALAIAIGTMGDDYEETDLEHVQSKAWAREQAATLVVPAASAIPAVAAQDLQPPADAQALASADWSGNSWGPESHHTTHFVTADCSGTLVSITQTIGPVFGSKVITPDLGFVYASTMGTYLAGSAQKPGSRPRTTIAPTVLTKNGEPVLVLGAAGGLRILSAIVQTISRYVDQGMPLQAAVAAPRVHPQSETDDAGQRHSQRLKFHAETSPDIGWTGADLAAWQSAGFDVRENPRTAAFGRIHAIERTANGWQGVADPDWEGTAEGARLSACRL